MINFNPLSSFCPLYAAEHSSGGWGDDQRKKSLVTNVIEVTSADLSNFIMQYSITVTYILFRKVKLDIQFDIFLEEWI